MKHIITTILFAATCCVASGESISERWSGLVIRGIAGGYIMGQQNRSIAELESALVLMADGANELTSNQVALAASVKRADCFTIVTQPCQRTHCDTPAPMPMPWGFTNQHPIITLPYIVGTNDTIYRWMNQPNTWPGTYSNYVTNINANVEKEN